MLLRVTQALLLAAAISAVLLARRRPDHLPFAIFLFVVAVATAIRDRLAALYPLLRPLGSPPLEGAARVALHMDQALFLTWAGGIATTSIVLFAERRRLAILPGIAWIGLVAYLATHYPAVRGEDLRRVYLAAELGALCVAAACIILWTWRRLPPTPARVGLLAVAIVDGVTLVAGAWRHGFWDHWHLQQIALTLLYATLTIFQVLTWRQASLSQR